VFDDWHDPPGVKILVTRDQPVEVMITQLWPEAGRAMFLSPAPIRAYGLYVPSIARGRLVAWMRRTSGTWLAVVNIDASSPDGRSTVTMTLWCPAHTVRPVR
jgi:hypothetical protein